MNQSLNIQSQQNDNPVLQSSSSSDDESQEPQNINASSLGINVFAGSDINNYGKFYTYGTKINLGVAQVSSLILGYKTEDRKQKVTTMDVRFIYDLTSRLGLNLGYKSTETKNAAGTAVVLKGNTTYAGITFRF